MSDHWKTVSQETYVPHASGVQVRAAAVRRAQEIAETQHRLEHSPKFNARSNSELSFAPPVDPVVSKKSNPKRVQGHSSSPERKFTVVSTAADTYRPAPQELLVASLASRSKSSASQNSPTMQHNSVIDLSGHGATPSSSSSIQSESRRAFVPHQVKAVHKRHDRDHVLPPRKFDSLSTYQGTYGHADQ